MNNAPSQTQQIDSPQQLTDLLAAEVLCALQERSMGRDMLIWLTDDPVLLRSMCPDGDPAPSPRNLLEEVRRLGPRWRLITRTRDIFSFVVGKVPAVLEMLDWNNVFAPCCTVHVCRWAAVLARQVGTTIADIPRVISVPAGLDTTYEICRTRSAEACKAIEQAVSAMGSRIQDHHAEALFYKITSADGCPQVASLTESGLLLGSEPLDEFCRRIVEPAANMLMPALDRMRALRVKRDPLNDDYTRLLPARVNALLNAGRQVGERAGMWLCSARVNGMPASFYLFASAEPMNRTPALFLTLEARRAHEDFVLESDEGNRYYFPPCQIVARIRFDATAAKWFPERPTIRQPAGALWWNHPYTGPLGNALSPAFRMIGPEGAEPMLEPSIDVRAIVPNMPPAVSKPVERDICLNGQETALADLQNSVPRTPETDGVPDILQLVRGIWSIARNGLTRAHQDNTNTPREHMTILQMPYPLPSWFVPGRNLRDRVFTYARPSRRTAG